MNFNGRNRREERQRERDLASEQRAGSWVRRRAREMQYRFVRRHWRVLLLVVAVGAALCPATLMLPESQRWFALGFWTATVLGASLFLIVVMSGSAYLVTADHAEQWTRHELNGLRRSGWRVIHRVLLRAGEDVDHLAIGPGGVVVVETKWSTSDWTGPPERVWVMQAVRQARENARIGGLYLRPDVGEAIVWPVIALWPSDDRVTEREIDGVTVLSGAELRGWIARRPENVLEAEAVGKAWRRLSDHLARRDAADLERYGPPPRAVGDFLADMVQLAFGLLVGLMSGGLLLRWLGWPLFSIPELFIAAGALIAMRVPRAHRLASGMLAGGGTLIAFTLTAELLAVFK
jgi:hypothetical protein